MENVRYEIYHAVPCSDPFITLPLPQALLQDSFAITNLNPEPKNGDQLGEGLS